MLVGFGAFYGAAQSFPPLISFHRLPAAAGKFGGFGSTRAGRYAWQHRRGPIGPTRGRPWPPGGYLSLASEGSLVRRVCRAIVLRRRDAMRRESARAPIDAYRRTPRAKRMIAVHHRAVESHWNLARPRKHGVSQEHGEEEGFRPSYDGVKLPICTISGLSERKALAYVGGPWGNIGGRNGFGEGVDAFLRHRRSILLQIVAPFYGSCSRRRIVLKERFAEPNRAPAACKSVERDLRIVIKSLKSAIHHVTRL